MSATSPEGKLYEFVNCELTFNTKNIKFHNEKIHNQDIAQKTEPVNASTFFKCDCYDFRSDSKGCVEHHIETTCKELQFQGHIYQKYEHTYTECS